MTACIIGLTTSDRGLHRLMKVRFWMVILTSFKFYIAVKTLVVIIEERDNGETEKKGTSPY